MDSLPVVTFGKYKGQPVTALLADTKYLEWCKQQDFFKNQTTIYNICVNQTIQSGQSKTPEHNKLQNLFLKREFLEDITKYLTGFDKTLSQLEKLYCTEEYKKYFGDQRFDTVSCLKKIKYSPVFEGDFNWDVILDSDSVSSDILIDEMFLPKVEYYDNYRGEKERLNRTKETETHVNELIKRDLPYLHKKCGRPYVYLVDKNEKYKVSLSLYVSLSDLYIEIKPLLGDDYPNVLRKMNTQIKLTKSNKMTGMWILLIDKFSSPVTTKEELVEIFRQSYINVVFVGDISNGFPLEISSEKIKRLEEENRQLKEKIKQLELLQSK